jgi:hypothetical protein
MSRVVAARCPDIERQDISCSRIALGFHDYVVTEIQLSSAQLGDRKEETRGTKQKQPFVLCTVGYVCSYIHIWAALSGYRGIAMYVRRSWLAAIHPTTNSRFPLPNPAPTLNPGQPGVIVLRAAALCTCLPLFCVAGEQTCGKLQNSLAGHLSHCIHCVSERECHVIPSYLSAISTTLRATPTSPSHALPANIIYAFE